MKTDFNLKAIFLLLALASLLGCSSTRPPRYFAATATMVFVPKKPPADDIRRATPSAGALLHKANVLVGFAPPGICRGAMHVSVGLEIKVESLCQTLMSGLEKTASARGYRVLDWNQLRGDPYRTASDKHVNVLFVIDDLSVRAKKDERYEITAVSFSEQKSATRREPYRLDNTLAVGARCKSVFSAQEKAKTAPGGEVTGLTAAVKMVSVQDGVSQWYYRHSEDLARPVESEKIQDDLYYLSRGTKERGIGKIVVSTIFAGIGIASAVVGNRLYHDGTSLALRNVGVGLSWFTIVPFLVALPIGAVGVYKEVKPAVYDAPEDVICRDAPLLGNPYLTNTDGQAGTSVVVNPHPSAATATIRNDTRDARIEAESKLLTDALVAHFFSELDILVKETAPVSDTTPDASTGPSTAVDTEGEPVSDGVLIEDSDTASAPAPDMSTESTTAVDVEHDSATPDATASIDTDSSAQQSPKTSKTSSNSADADEKAHEETP